MYNRALSTAEVQQLYDSGVVNVAHSNTFISNGLIGYWTFDGSSVDWFKSQVADVSGNGNTGQLLGMSTSSSPVPGKIGQALMFGNGGVYIPMPTTTTFPVTMSAWIYSASSTQSAILVYNGVSGSNGYGILLTNGTCSPGTKVTLLLGGVNCDILSSTYSPPINQWVHIAIVKASSGAPWLLYVNGLLTVTGGTTNANTPTSNFEIGENLNSLIMSPPSFAGKIDDVRIYNRALSAAEVNELYKSGR
jgi:hypothetical protein